MTRCHRSSHCVYWLELYSIHCGWLDQVTHHSRRGIKSCILVAFLRCLPVEGMLSLRIRSWLWRIFRTLIVPTACWSINKRCKIFAVFQAQIRLSSTVSQVAESSPLYTTRFHLCDGLDSEFALFYFYCCFPRLKYANMYSRDQQVSATVWAVSNCMYSASDCILLLHHLVVNTGRLLSTRYVNVVVVGRTHLDR